MKLLPQIIILTIIDFVLIWIWVKAIDPDPSISIGLIILVPLVFGLNLIAAGIVYFIKKEFVKLFLFNTIIASTIMYFLFIEGINRHQRLRLESWEFQKTDTIFTIIRWKESNTFNMSYSTNPGSSWGLEGGSCEIESDEIILYGDSTEYKIKDMMLFGFREVRDTIKLKKIER